MNQANIVITIDDVGYSTSIDESAIELVQSVVNRMAVFTTYKDVSYLKDYIDMRKIGIHFNLSSGCCLSDIDNISTIANKNGNYFKPIANNTLEIKDVLSSYINSHINQLSLNEVVLELKLQVEKFKSYFKFLPSFITFHHDIDKSHLIQSSLKQVCKQKSRQELIEKNYMHSYSIFLSDSDDIQSSIRRVRSLLKKSLLKSYTQNGLLVEIVIHTSCKIEDMSNFTIYQKQRYLEYKAWTSIDIKEIFKNAKLQNNIWKFDNVPLILKKVF